eukprot:1712429-Rhodomonas_salina.1
MADRLDTYLSQPSYKKLKHSVSMMLQKHVGQHHVLEPDAEDILRNNQSPDIKLRRKGEDAGEDHQAYL